jgi:penicillin-binding protein 2
MRRRQLKNAFAEAMQFRTRALIAFAAVALALFGLGGWYFRLQVLEHDEYATRSEANRIKPRPVVPGRGLILDRKGRVLAENVPAFRLDVVPDQAGDTQQLVASLSKIVALDPEDIERFDVERKARHGWRPITLKMRVGEEEAARFAVDRWRFPGVELVPYLNRHYPYGDLLAHIIGYVGRIDQADLAKMGEVDAALTHTGKTGLERYTKARCAARSVTKRSRRMSKVARCAASARCPRCRARTCACRSTSTCRKRWSRRSATTMVRRSRSIRAPAKSSRW